jgi:hypothetical protein
VRARWLDERHARPPSAEPGVLLQIGRIGPFAAWGTSVAGRGLEPDAIGTVPPKGTTGKLPMSIAPLRGRTIYAWSV